MPIDIANGLSQMGEQVAKVTGMAALEQQKSGLENERLKLANDLATQRESLGRQETATLTAAENRRHETFLSTQTDKQIAGNLEGHRISAGASMASAGMHLTAIREQIAFQAAQPDYKVADDGTLLSIPKQSKDASGKSVPSIATPVAGPDGKPMHVANPEKAQAVAKLVDVTKDQLTNVTRLYETDLKQGQAELKSALDAAKLTAAGMTDPNSAPGVIEAKKAIETARQKYEPQINTMNKRLDALYSDLGVKSGMPTQKPGGYDLNKYIKGGDTPAAPETPAPAGNGLINNQAGGPR